MIPLPPGWRTDRRFLETVTVPPNPVRSEEVSLGQTYPGEALAGG